MSNLLKKLTKRFAKDASEKTPDPVKDFVFMQILKTILLVGSLYAINRVIEHWAGK